MKLPNSFVADGDEMGSFDTIPSDTYPFMIVKSEIALTKAAKAAKNPALGQLLKMQAKIIAGEFKDRIVFIQLNIVNENEQAVEISNKELTSICKAVGKKSIKDSNEVHGIPFMGKIGIETDENGKYPDKNVFLGYGPYSEKGAKLNKKDKKKGKKRKKTPWD